MVHAKRQSVCVSIRKQTALLFGNGDKHVQDKLSVMSIVSFGCFFDVFICIQILSMLEHFRYTYSTCVTHVLSWAHKVVQPATARPSTFVVRNLL